MQDAVHLRPERPRADLGASEQIWRNDARGLDGRHRPFDLPREGACLTGDDEDREMIRDDQRCFSRERSEQTGRGRAASLEMKEVADLLFRQLGCEVDRALEDEGVDAVVGAGIVGPQALVREDR